MNMYYKKDFNKIFNQASFAVSLNSPRSAVISSYRLLMSLKRDATIISAPNMTIVEPPIPILKIVLCMINLLNNPSKNNIVA